MTPCTAFRRLLHSLSLFALLLNSVPARPIAAQGNRPREVAPAATGAEKTLPFPNPTRTEQQWFHFGNEAEHPVTSEVAKQARSPTFAGLDGLATTNAPTTQQFLPVVLASIDQTQSQFGLNSALPFGLAPLTVTLSAMLNGNPVPNDNPYHFVWQWGDDTGATGSAAHHVYPTPGVYTVTLTAYNLPDIETLTHKIVVYDPQQITLGQVDARGGVVTTPQGDLWLEFAPGAVREPYYIFIQQIDLTTVTTDTVDGLPALEVPGFGLPFRQISLYAARVSDSNWLTQTIFSAPVTMTHVYSAAVVDALLLESLHFVYLNEQTGAFEPVTSTVDIDDSQVSAVVSHFSDYGVAGDQAAWQTPMLDAAEVSLAKGQSTYHYALPLPKGPGGFQPQVNLSYSSSQPNSMAGDKNTDGGWVGVGWTLDSGQISGDNLSLNGVGGQLRKGADGFYYIEEDPSLRIQRIDQPLPAQEGVTGGQGAYRWEVTDKAGTVYFFGKDESGAGSALAYRRQLSGSQCEQRFVAYKLARVVDIHGNTLTIEYNEIANPDGCGSHTIPVIRESYPRAIRYTTNAQSNDQQAEYVIEFVAEPKGYTAVDRSYGDGNYRLTRIDIWYYPLGSERQRVRSVAFGYTVNPTGKFSLLNAVTLLGADGVTTLPSLQMTYGQHDIGYNKIGKFQRHFLESVRNGYGGEVRFTYQMENWSGRGLFQVVTERMALDAITQINSTRRYAYDRARIKLLEKCTSITPAGDCNDHIRLGGFDRFFGFAQVDAAEPLGRWQRHLFNNEPNSLRNGRIEATYTYAGALAVADQLYAATQNEWAERTTPANIQFLYQAQSRSFTCFGQSGGQDVTPCLSTRTVNHVDEYGNPTQTTVYDADGQPRQTTVHVLEKHPTRWLFRSREERLHQGDQITPTSQLAATYLRYDDVRWTLPQITRAWAGNDDQGTAQYLDVTYSYDAYGNAVGETVYNSYGTATGVAVAADRTTNTTYDDQGLLPVRVTNPLNQTVVTAYDYRFQTPTQITDSNGAATVTHYDAFGRLTTVDLPLCAAAVQASYGDSAYTNSGQPYFERLRQRIDECTGNAATYNDLYVFYSGLGRKLQAQSSGDQGDTVLTQVTYDAQGRLVRSGVPYRVAAPPGQYRPLNPDLRSWPTGFTQTSYDVLDRPVRITAPNGSVTRREYGWDTIGDDTTPTQRLLTRSFDANGHRTDQVSDEWGNLLRVREFSGNSTYQLYGELAYTYDIQNRLSIVRDAAGNTTQLTYDTLGRKTRMIDPDMGEWHYTYDALGNLIRQTDAAQTVTRLAYDVLNRLTHKEYELPPGSTVAPAPPVSYFYEHLADGSPVANGIGRRVQMDDGLGSVTWQYDQQGRVLSEARTFTGIYVGLANTQNNGAYLTRYRYNAADWVTAVTYPDGEVVTTGYTPRGLAQSQTGSMVGDLVRDTVYNELGQMTRQTTGDGLTTNYTYYPATRANNRLKEIKVGSGELNLAYTYDAVGNITAVTDASQRVGSERLLYTYDHLDRLTQATATGGALAGYNLSYEYDKIGNLTARSSGGQQLIYQYGGKQSHAVTAVGADRYVYDANGNMVNRTEDGITYTQRWNPFNKLAQVRWQRDGQECNVQFVYDGDGNRLLKISGQGNLETTTYYAGQMFEKQFNTTATPLGERMPANPSGTSFTACTGAGNGMTDFGFTGQRNETEFGLMDFNARFYSPRLGRFVSPDTIVPDPVDAKSYNRYSYVNNNPLKYNDPSGHTVNVVYDPKNNMIRVTTTIEIYDYHGTMSTADLAKAAANFENGIETEWQGQTYEGYPVQVDVTLIVGSDACSQGDNCIGVVTPDASGNYDFSGTDCASTGRSCVTGNILESIGFSLGISDSLDEGYWVSDHKWTSAHEFGHLAGLGDDYETVAPGNTKARLGHAGDMMADYGGKVSQHEVDDMMPLSVDLQLFWEEHVVSWFK